MNKVEKTDHEWHTQLGPEQYRVLRQAGTEYPGAGLYLNNWESGQYVCAGCGNMLFHSDAKYDSGCGWPAFNEVASGDGIEFGQGDKSDTYGLEVHCKQCGGHLGHIFDVGSHSKTGDWYCINSVALNFVPRVKK